MAACHKWGLPEIGAGLHTVHLHKDLSDGFESTFTQVADTTKMGGEDNLPCEEGLKELYLICLEERRLEGRGLISICQSATKRMEALLTKDRTEKTRHNRNFLMVRTTNDSNTGMW